MMGAKRAPKTLDAKRASTKDASAAKLLYTVWEDSEKRTQVTYLGSTPVRRLPIDLMSRHMEDEALSQWRRT